MSERLHHTADPLGVLFIFLQALKVRGNVLVKQYYAHYVHHTISTTDDKIRDAVEALCIKTFEQTLCHLPEKKTAFDRRNSKKRQIDAGCWGKFNGDEHVHTMRRLALNRAG